MQQAELMELLHYDQLTGVFRWKKSRSNGVKPGDVAGTVTKRQGYLRIFINLKGYRKGYLAHRLAWLYVYGSMPSDHIDHINGNKADNRIENLRQASNTTNHWNEAIRSTNKSGHKGVFWHTQSKRWRASCRVGGKPEVLGQFERIEDAVEAVRKFRERHHGEYANHG
jgi:hypothetical protein